MLIPSEPPSPVGTPTSTPAAALPSVLHAFTRTHADDLVRAAKPGEVHVVTAAPGQGKSTLIRRAIKDALFPASGVRPRVQRVLWATQSIATATALGAEARRDFMSLGVPVQIVYSKADFDELGLPGRFEDQFTWPIDSAGRSTPMVKIISHVRVHLVFGSPADLVSEDLNQAELMVIDEDPTSGLLLSSPTSPTGSGIKPALSDFRLEQLARTGDAVCLALVNVLRFAEANSAGGSAIKNFTLTTGFDLGHGLYGREFWRLFQRAHPLPVDAATFSAALDSSGIKDAGVIAEAFAEDARYAPGMAGTPQSYRTRFGVHWSGRVAAADWARLALLRFNVRKKLKFELPVIVLDGYADPELYRALFLEQNVKIHEFAPAFKLTVECSELMTVNPLEDRVQGSTKGLAHRLHVAEELAARRAEQLRGSPGSKQLSLTSKALYEPKCGWQELLQQAYSAQGLTFHHPSAGSTSAASELDQLYWHAGRGLDTYSGADIYALTLPKLSLLNMDYTLAAVLLDDPVLRARLQNHAWAAELLQMLNRGRQPGLAAAGGPVPRIVVGADLEKVKALLGDFADRVNLQAYRPLLQLTKGSPNPRWRDAVTALAKELLALPQFAHGLPNQLLECLPTHSTNRSSQARTATTAKLATLAATTPPESHLYKAFHDQPSWRYQAIAPGGGNSTRMLEEAMAAPGLGLTPQKVSSITGRAKVYVRPGTTLATAEAAHAAFNGWR